MIEPIDRLTPAEKRVADLLVSGATTHKELARRLDVCESTVSSHLNGIFNKLGVYDKTQAAIVILTGKPLNVSCETQDCG